MSWGLYRDANGLRVGEEDQQTNETIQPLRTTLETSNHGTRQPTNPPPNHERPARDHAPTKKETPKTPNSSVTKRKALTQDLRRTMEGEMSDLEMTSNYFQSKKSSTVSLGTWTPVFRVSEPDSESHPRRIG